MSAALQLRIDKLRVAFLTAFVDMVRQRNMELLMPHAPKQSAPKTVTISLQVAPPTASQIQQAYLPASPNGSASILSIVA